MALGRIRIRKRIWTRLFSEVGSGQNGPDPPTLCITGLIFLTLGMLFKQKARTPISQKKKKNEKSGHEAEKYFGSG
jgi:hypothetical protein